MKAMRRGGTAASTVGASLLPTLGARGCRGFVHAVVAPIVGVNSLDWGIQAVGFGPRCQEREFILR